MEWFLSNHCFVFTTTLKNISNTYKDDGALRKLGKNVLSRNEPAVANVKGYQSARVPSG